MSFKTMTMYTKKTNTAFTHFPANETVDKSTFATVGHTHNSYFQKS